MQHLFKALTLFSIAMEWSAQALADRKVTAKEALDLAEKVAKVLDIPLEIEIPE